MNESRLQLLVKQSKFNSDISIIIDTISPIICNKKITKREIDKANTALLNKFGYHTYADGESKTQLYRIAKWDNYGSCGVKIYTSDRWVKDGEHTVAYIPDDTKTIYSDDGIITTESINKYKPSSEYTPTKAQIESSYKKYEQLRAKIRELENKRSELPFHYYFK